MNPSRAFVILALAVTLIVSSCSRPAERSPLATGKVVTAAELRNAFGYATTGDTAYAVVSADALRAFYADFRAETFRQGVTKWDERFDCNHFAGYYVALAQTRYYLANFHTSTPAQTLALGVLWYRPGARKKAHAIVQALTDRGIVSIEPQTGDEITLTPNEQASALLRLF